MNPFYNNEEKRVRSFWRILVHTILFFIGTVIFGIVYGIVQTIILITQGNLQMETLTDPAALSEMMMTAGNGSFFAINGIATVVIMVITFLIAGWALDRRKFKDFGFRFSGQWFIDFGFGLILGAVLMGFIFLAELMFGWVEVTGYMTTASGSGSAFYAILISLIGFIGVGIYEEMLSRGYHLRNLAEGLSFKAVGPRVGLWLAYLISSSIFGILHIGNANASLVSTLNIILAGFFLGLGFVLTGELAIPIGLHITWNFFQGNVFGFPVSGSTPAGTMIRINQLGPDWITGGAFGPEAGLIGILAIALGCVLTVLYVKKTRGNVGIKYDLAVYEPVHKTAVDAAALEKAADLSESQVS